MAPVAVNVQTCCKVLSDKVDFFHTHGKTYHHTVHDTVHALRSALMVPDMLKRAVSSGPGFDVKGQFRAAVLALGRLLLENPHGRRAARANQDQEIRDNLDLNIEAGSLSEDELKQLADASAAGAAGSYRWTISFRGI